MEATEPRILKVIELGRALPQAHRASPRRECRPPLGVRAIVIDPTWHAMFGVLDREAGTQVEEMPRVHADPDEDHTAWLRAR